MFNEKGAILKKNIPIHHKYFWNLEEHITAFQYQKKAYKKG